jgi:O-antigen/teichoic acid export membrane protein
MELTARSPAADSEYAASVREVEKGGRISFLTSVFGQGIRVCFHIMMGRFLGPAGYGLYNLGHSILETAHLVSLVGFHNSAVHFLSIFRGEGDESRVRGTIFYATIIVSSTSSLVALALWLLAPWLSEYVFEKPTLGGVLRGFAIALPFYVLLVLFAHYARGFRNMKYYNGALDVIHPLGNLVLIGGAFWIGMGLEGAILGFVLSTALAMLLMVPALLKLFPQLLMAERGYRFEAKRILSYSARVAPVDLSRPFLHDQKDNMLLGYFGVARDIGIYGASSLIGMKIGFFQHMFNGIFAPMIADLYNRGQHRELSQLFKTVSKWTLLLTLPVFFAFVFAGPAFLALFGREFREGWAVLAIMAVCKLINISTGPAGFMLLMTGHPSVELMNSFVLGSGNLLLNLWLIPRYGALGAAMGTGLSMIFINALRLGQVYYLLGCHPFRLGTAKALLAFGLSWGGVALASQWITFEGWWTFVAILPFTLLYGLLLTVFGWDKEDTIVIEHLRGRVRSLLKAGTKV